MSNSDSQKAIRCQNSMIFFMIFQIPWFLHDMDFFLAIFHVFQSLWEPWNDISFDISMYNKTVSLDIFMYNVFSSDSSMYN